MNEWQHKDSYSASAASAEPQVFRGGKRQKTQGWEQDWIFSSCLQIAVKINCSTGKSSVWGGGDLQHLPNNAVISRQFQSKVQSSRRKLRAHRERVGEIWAVLLSSGENSPGFRHLSKNSFFRSHKPIWFPTHHQRWKFSTTPAIKSCPDFLAFLHSLVELSQIFM